MAGEFAKLWIVMGVQTESVKTALSDLNREMGKAERDWKKNFNNIGKEMTLMGKQMMIAGGAVTAGMGVAVNSFAKTGDELVHMSEKTGISVQSLSELKFAAEVADVSLTDLQTAFKGMSGVMEIARGGGEAAIKTFASLGLKFEDLKDLNPEDLFMTVASAIAKVEDPIRRAALAVDVFGRSGMTLIPMFADGADGIAKLRQQAIDLGVTMGDETAKSAHELSIAFTTIKTSVTGVFNSIGTALAPTLKDLTDKIIKTVSGITAWTKAHPELTKVIVTVTAAIGVLLFAMGVLVFTFGKIITSANLASLSLIGHRIAMIANNAVVYLGVAANLSWTASIIAASVALVAFVAGLAMVGWGITTLINQTNALKQAQQQQKTLQEEIAKANRGEANTALDLAQAIYGAVEAKRQSGKATKEDLEWLAQYGPAYLTAIEQLKGMKKAQEDATDAKVNASEIDAETTKKMIENFKTLSSEAKRRATETTQAQISGFDKEIAKENSRFNNRMSNLSEEYNAIIKNIDAELGIVLDGYQAQIDAINNKTSAEDLALEKEAEQRRLTELQLNLNKATTAEDRAQAQLALDDYKAEIQRNDLLRQRATEIANIEAQMQTARNNAQSAKDTAQANYDDQVKKQTDLHTLTITNLGIEKTLLDTALTEQLKRYDDDLAAFDENTALKLKSLNDFIRDYNAALAGLKSAKVSISTSEVTAPSSVPTPREWEDIVNDVPAYAMGGIVTKPTLAMVGESGPEMITPLNSMGNRVINLYVGNKLLKSFVLDDFSKDLRLQGGY
jgi:hypothetical protein